MAVGRERGGRDYLTSRKVDPLRTSAKSSSMSSRARKMPVSAVGAGAGAGMAAGVAAEAFDFFGAGDLGGSSTGRAQVKTGLIQNQLDAAAESADVQKNNVELQRSNLMDTDMAEATAGLVKSNALLQAAQSIMSKLDANSLFQKL